MNKETQEKSLSNVRETGIFNKIKAFFKRWFVGEEKQETVIINKEQDFKEELKNVENEETKLVELQKKYRAGEIAAEELTMEQIDALCNLYDKQILDIEKSIENKKVKLANYKKK